MHADTSVSASTNCYSFEKFVKLFPSLLIVQMRGSQSHGAQEWGGPSGELKRGAYRFLFLNPTLLSLDPMSAWASPPPLVGQGNPACLGIQPSNSTLNKEEMVKIEKIRFPSSAVGGPVCFTDFCSSPLLGLVV